VLVSYAKLMQLHEVSIRVSRPQQGVVDAEARAIMAPIRLGRLHESTAALHGGVAAALTAALMPCRTIPRLAAVPALTTALKCYHAPKDRIHRRREEAWA
jgi:hypothetical protein